MTVLTPTRPATPDTPAVDAGGPRIEWYRRPMMSAFVLGLVLVGLMLATDPMGFLSTDVGGKVATLEAMQRNGGLSPDLGYWAEAVDPDGSLYPMWSTAHVGDAWVNVTSLPMLVLAYPLFLLGGLTAAGLVPVAGSVAAALGARSLARRLGADGSAAFWIVGAASPVTVYALDFWEHSLGVALVLWAVVAVLDAAQPDAAQPDARRPVPAAFIAGVLFGVAAALRQEAIVYGFVAGAALGVRVVWSGRLLGAVGRGVAMATGFAAAWTANAALEAALMGGTVRTGRSTGTAAAAGGDVALRAKEAIVTLASPFARFDAVYLLIALVTIAALVELGRRAGDERAELRPVVLVLGAVVALWLVDIVGGGLSFVPGLAATTPVAALAATRVWRTSDLRMVGVIAIGSLPLVWAVQYTGGALPQWGGRYILSSGALLAVGATVVMRDERSAAVLRRVALVGLVVTLAGVGWTIERTHGFADAMDELALRSEPVLVFHDPHLAREGGVHLLDEQWLAATGTEQRAEAARALAALGVTEIGFVEHDHGEPRILPGWRIVETERVDLVSGLHLRVTTQVPVTP